MGAHVGWRGHRMQSVARTEGRRRDILLAAARVFARDGYVDATLDDVATQMGVTKGVIYYYFPRKEAIFTEIRATAIREAIAGTELTERDEVVCLRGAVRYFDLIDRRPGIMRADSLSQLHRAV